MEDGLKATLIKPVVRARRRWAIAAILALALAIAVVLWDVRGLVRAALIFTQSLGPWGPILFIVIYALAAVLFVPGSALTLGAGAIFGVVLGSIYVSLASTLGATAAFLMGRYLARDWVAKKTECNPTFAALDSVVAEEGWRIVMLMRLSPAFPFTVLNYAFGLTRVRLRDYVIASWIGMMPGTVMYVYLGSLAREGVTRQRRSPAEWTVYTLGLAATIAVTIVITRGARHALAKQVHKAS
jgi:uncharacterized membrane protein YdjX (TVP38/TMEM64 family)